MGRMAAGMSRLGTESAFDVLARAKALEEEGRDIINLGIGQPDFTTPDNIVEAAVKALRDGHHGYTPAGGIGPLREAVAADIEKHRRVAGVMRSSTSPALNEKPVSSCSGMGTALAPVKLMTDS